MEESLGRIAATGEEDEREASDHAVIARSGAAGTVRASNDRAELVSTAQGRTSPSLQGPNMNASMSMFPSGSRTVTLPR